MILFFCAKSKSKKIENSKPVKPNYSIEKEIAHQYIMYCPKNNLNLCRKTELVTVGAYAMHILYVWLCVQDTGVQYSMCKKAKPYFPTGKILF